MGGIYPRELIAHLQRNKPTDSNNNVDIVCNDHESFLK
jgi:hypothetical protein